MPFNPTPEALARVVKPRDIVILHDPQTAGLVAPMKEVADIVVWRCHVGLDTPNDIARNAWDFLDEHVEMADAHVFSRQAFVWLGLDPEKTVIIPPSIDAFSPKNQELGRPIVDGILDRLRTRRGWRPWVGHLLQSRRRAGSRQTIRRARGRRSASRERRTHRHSGVAVGSPQGSPWRHEGLRGSRCNQQRRPSRSSGPSRRSG